MTDLSVNKLHWYCTECHEKMFVVEVNGIGYAEHNRLREHFPNIENDDNVYMAYVRFCKLAHDGLYLAMLGIDSAMDN